MHRTFDFCPDQETNVPKLKEAKILLSRNIYYALNVSGPTSFVMQEDSGFVAL